jgi:hypothetical protein
VFTHRERIVSGYRVTSIFGDRALPDPPQAPKQPREEILGEAPLASPTT